MLLKQTQKKPWAISLFEDGWPAKLVSSTQHSGYTGFRWKIWANFSSLELWRWACLSKTHTGTAVICWAFAIKLALSQCVLSHFSPLHPVGEVASVKQILSQCVWGIDCAWARVTSLFLWGKWTSWYALYLHGHHLNNRPFEALKHSPSEAFWNTWRH